MEEFIRPLLKISSNKEQTDPALLFTDCQHQVDRLNAQLSLYMEGLRQRQVRVVLPNL